jgi:phosphotransferase system enzyme I (PtsI)
VGGHSEKSDGGQDERARLERSGIAASPGVGIGKAYVVDRRRVHVPRTQIERGAVQEEVHRFREAVGTTQEQVEAIKARLPHGEHRQILKAQQMMLRDPDLLQTVETLIREESINAEWAVTRAIDDIKEKLDQADEQYFRERRSDMTFLVERVVLNLQGDHRDEIQPPVGAVVVAHDLSPADTAQLARVDVAGIVTDVGGQTSHSAIMARSLEIPAVVGLVDMISNVRSGDDVIVNGIQGIVIVRPGERELETWQGERERYDAFEDRVQKDHALPATTRDGVHVALRANVALEEEIGSALFHGAEGVGLYRTEYLYLDRDTLPTEEEHYRRAKAVLQKTAPYPVIFRTFDLGSDKPCKLFSFHEPEANPAMGVRSMRLALRERGAFLAQLRGLHRAALHGPLGIMLPLVSGLAELRQGLDAVAEAREQLENAGMAYAEDVAVGIMIEMPSAALVADVLVRHVDFVSIGTNDLIQYTLAIDRDNDHVGHLYRPLHPAILRLIHQVACAGAEAEVPVSLCGEMAADPRVTWVLCGLGVMELSMHSSAIPVIKSIIRGSDTSEMMALAGACLQASDTDAAELLVLEAMEARFPEHLRHGGGQRLGSSEDSAPERA